MNFYVFFLDVDEVYCLIKRGEYLGPQKIVHIPGIPIGATALTKEDENYVRLGIQLKVDVIMIPGVRNAGFFDHVKNFVCKCVHYSVGSLNLFWCIVIIGNFVSLKAKRKAKK